MHFFPNLLLFCLPPLCEVDVTERVITLPSHFRTPAGDEEYESSLDNDDDVSSDEDRSNGKNIDSDVCISDKILLLQLDYSSFLATEI